MSFNKIFRLFIIIVVIWMIGCVTSFLSGPAIIFLGAPSWLPLPWSDFDDFVQSPDGKVLVDIKFYNRVLCYGGNGEFIASYPYPPGKPKVTGLAVNGEGHVFFRARNNLYVYNNSWNLLEKVEGEFSIHRHWRLGEDGKPVYATVDIEAPKVPDRAAKPGEYLFREDSRRTMFTCKDGSRLVRERNQLKRYSAEGGLIGKYSEPWFLSIFTFPWPALLAWPIAFLFAYVENRKRFLLGQQKKSDPNKVRKRLLLDTTVTALFFIITTAAIVMGGSVVMVIANALPKSNPMHFWLVPIVVIPYWIIVIIVAFWTWRSLLRRLGEIKPADSEGNGQNNMTTIDLQEDSGMSSGNKNANG